MGAGIYTIPMNEYYSKSKSLKDSVKEVAEAVQTNFLKKVEDNINELDEQDQTYLEGSSPYTSAKTLYTTLTDTHLKNLENMSSFNSQNPLYAIEHNDKEYAAQFKAVAEGNLSNEITNTMGAINQQIDIKKGINTTVKFLSSIDNTISENEWIQRIEKAGGLLPFLEGLANGTRETKFLSFEKLLYDPSVGQAMVSSKRAEKFLEFWMDLPYTIKNSKIVTGFSKIAGKINGYISDTKIVTGLANGKFITSASKIAKKVIKSDLAKKVFKYGGTGLLVATTAINIGSSAYKNWNDEKTNSRTAAGKVGKAVVGTAIDQIKNAGPFEGMWAGAKLGMMTGHPLAAAGGLVVGGILGAANQIGQAVFPKQYDKGISAIKDGAYKVVDWAEKKVIDAKNAAEKNIKNVGKAVEKGLDKVKSVGKSIKSAFGGGLKLATSWFE
ncbi:hypothetical protein ACSFB8_04010 [Enterococcus faecalis]